MPDKGITQGASPGSAGNPGIKKLLIKIGYFTLAATATAVITTGVQRVDDQVLGAPCETVTAPAAPAVEEPAAVSTAPIVLAEPIASTGSGRPVMPPA